jgi:endonuclease/exonuclease/phosphatase family metal-dependent hydrolase
MRIAVVLVAGLLIGACEGGARPRSTPTPGPEATPTVVAGTPTPAVPIDSVRVAYLNLMSPLEDGEDSLAWVTYGDRIDIAIANLGGFDADLIGVSEAAWVEGLEENAWVRLQNSLKLEPSILARANPWPWNTTQEESDAAVVREGYEEGEYLLSRYPILSSKRYPLSQRVSLQEGRAVLHAVVKLPAPVGETDVYVTRFGGDEGKKSSQAQELIRIVALTHSPERAIIVMGDLGATPGSDVLATLLNPDYGLKDAFAAVGSDYLTCCRESVVESTGGGTPEASAETETDADPANDGATTTPEPEEPPVPVTIAERRDFILSGQWGAQSVQLIGNEPSERPDGSQLYASDHNGIGVVFYVGTAPQ